jgi:hypothetical protein
MLVFNRLSQIRKYTPLCVLALLVANIALAQTLCPHPSLSSIPISHYYRSQYSTGTGMYDSFQTATNGIAK